MVNLESNNIFTRLVRQVGILPSESYKPLRRDEVEFALELQKYPKL
jgi:hypothetical protein